MLRTLSGWNVLVDRIAQADQADRILLALNHHGQRPGDRARQVELAGEAIGRSHPHRGRRVDHEVDPHVRLHLVHLHVEPFRACQHPPIDRPQFVPAAILAVLDEFSREPVVAGAVPIVVETPDEEPRPQFDPLEPLQERRVERERFVGRGCHAMSLDTRDGDGGVVPPTGPMRPSQAASAGTMSRSEPITFWVSKPSAWPLKLSAIRCRSTLWATAFTPSIEAWV